MKYNRRQVCYEVPVSINIAVTEKCNLRCPFCFQEYGHKTDLDYSLLCDYLKQMADMGTYTVQFSGGDPLLYPYLEDSIEYAHRLGLYIRLSTSGQGLTVDFAKRLKKSGLDCLHFSLNGSNRDIHNKTRDGFEETISAIQIAIDTGILCTLNWVANSDNILDLENLINLAMSFGINNIDVLSNKPSYLNGIHLPYNIDDLHFLKSLCLKYPDYLRVEDCFNELRLLLLGNKIPVIDKGCKAGRFHMAIDAHGRFLPCPHLSAFSQMGDDISVYWKESVILKKLRASFKRGMGKSEQNSFGRSTCDFCIYQKVCNPCYIEQNGDIMHSIDVKPCIVFKD